MKSNPNMTFFPAGSSAARPWYLIDADGKVFGRVASAATKYLIGKNSVRFTPHADCGGCVVIINASKVRVTGNKRVQKIKFHHTGYPGGARIIPFGQLLDTRPERALYLAVKGMLPKTTLGNRMLTRLKIYREGTHIHQAQQLSAVNLK